MQSREPVYAAHIPQGTSVQNIVHYLQMIESEVCSFYDYGSENENIRKYNQTTPPILSARDVHLPVSLFAAQNDPLANPKVGRQAKNSIHTSIWYVKHKLK